MHHQGVVWALEGRRLTALTPAGEPTGREVALPFEGRVLAACGDHLAAAGPGAAALVDPVSAAVAATVGFSGAPTDLDISADGRRLLVVIDEEILLMIDAESGEEVSRRSQRKERGLTARFDAAGDALLAARSAYGVSRMGWGKRRAQRWMDTHSVTTPRIAADGDRRRLAVRCGGEVQVLDLDERVMVAGFRLHEGPACALAVEGDRVALGAEDGAVVLAEVDSGRVRVLGGEALQGPLCRARRRLPPRAIGQTADTLWMLTEEGALYEVTPEHTEPRLLLTLPLPRKRLAYFHQHGQVLRRGAQWWLLEREEKGATLRAFDDDARPLWSLRLPCARLTPLGGDLYGLGYSGAIARVRPVDEGPPEVAKVPIDSGGAQVGAAGPAPVPVGDALALRWQPKHTHSAEEFLWWPDGTLLSLGRCTYHWTSTDGRRIAHTYPGFALIWEGGSLREGPARRLEVPGEAYLGSGGWVQQRRIYEARWSESLRIRDRQGRQVHELQGHGEWISGLLLDAAEDRAVTWDRHGNLRWWELSGLGEGGGPGQILERGRFEYRWPSEVQAARAAALPGDPAASEQLAQIEALRGDSFALRCCAWGLPDEVEPAVDAALTEALGAWRPRLEVRGDKVNRWLKRSHDAASGERASAAWAFGFAGWEGLAGLERCIELLADPDLNVRGRAAQSLSSFGRHAAPAAVALAAALPDLFEFGQREAVNALVNIGGPAASPAAGLLAHKKAAVREQGADILRRIGPAAAAALPALVKAAGDRRSKTVRSTACHALGALGDPGAAAALETARGDKASEVRSAAAGALAKIGHPACRAALLAMLGGSAWEKRCAVEGLLAIGDPAALDAVRAALPPPGDAGPVYLHAWAQLGELEAALEGLRRCLLSGDGRQVQDAGGVVAALGAAAAPLGQALGAAIGDTERGWVRRELLEAAGAVGDPGARQVAAAQLAASEWVVRRTAAEVLERLGDPASIPALEAARSDEEPAVQAAADLAICALRGDQALLLERASALLEGPNGGRVGEAVLGRLARLGAAARPAEAAIRRALCAGPMPWQAAIDTLEAMGVDPWVDRR